MNIYSRLVRSLILPWVPVLTHSDFWRLYEHLHKHAESLIYCPPPDETLDKLKAIVNHAYRYVPFYRERMQTLGLTPDFLTTFDEFRMLPVATKSDIDANFPDRIIASQSIFKPWRYVSTTGTIERLTVVQDSRKRDYGRAAELLALNAATGYWPGMRYMEIPPNICTNVCGASDTLEPSVFRYFYESLRNRTLLDAEVVSNLRGLIDGQVLYRRRRLPSFDAAGLAQKPEVLNQYIEEIARFRPHLVKALSIYLYLLAIHILDHNIKPPQISSALMPMGSALTPHMKKVVEMAFRCAVHEDYGSAELGNMAAECGRQTGLHPFAGLFYIEVVRDGRPANDGELGRVLVTDLFNYAMPMIRYDIGDVAIRRQGFCACGLTGDRLEIQGRVEDCLIGKDGAVLAPSIVVDSILRHSGVLGFQLEWHGSNTVSLQVVPRNNRAINLQDICQEVWNLLGRQTPISVRKAPTVRPEPGGKYRLVKNRSKRARNIFFPEHLF